MKKILAVFQNDLKNITRELMLIYIMFIPVLFAILIRYGVPILREEFLEKFDLINYYPLITGYYILLVPVLIGIVAGFLVLDERDEGIVQVLILTPLSKKGYLIYRIFMPMLISLFYILILTPVLGLVAVSIRSLIILGLLSMLESPITALFLTAFAGNKVEGLAFSKGLGLLMLLPLLRFTKSKWTILAALIPFYWPVQGFLVIGEQGFYFSILAGFLVHLLFLFILVKKFKARLI
ncbi:ABC transporter permease subunit [Iocasia frigidifontis]|uniref:ABC transporter permease subunit n=1 Tax=Iocasia fonsfrigidae TaxID=2682810 RepID=A0A8A7KH29_9FIRM|nr:ABC transporter permease [Iocasia fonsfrigidae]QTL97454.1 ABC transporter permease subunit [Iocasia fonsfrigidae]